MIKNNFFFNFYQNNLNFFYNNLTENYKKLSYEDYINNNNLVENLFFSNSFNTKLSLTEDEKFLNYYDQFNLLKKYLYVKYSPFLNFFITNQLDTPICFKKTKSLEKKNSKLTLIKFVNFLTIDGKKEKYIKFFFKAINLFFNKNTNLKNIEMKNSFFFINHFNYNWKTVLFYISSFFNYSLNNQFNFFNFKNEEFENNYLLNYNKNQYDSTRVDNFFKNFKDYIYKLLIPIIPVFNFFVYNVDKNIRKFTRGKSGKFIFIWKYIPHHKRNNLILKLLKKNITFNEGKYYFLKIFNLLSQIIYYPKKNFLNKSKVFISNYVYKNFKQNLMVKMQTMK